jgi:hypothetical protein
VSRPRAAWAAMLAAAAICTTASDCDQPTKRDSYTCQAAQHDAQQNPNNPEKQKRRREACT